MKFEIRHLEKAKIKNPIFISGLPGIGNVGKVAIDFLIEQVKAKPIIEIFSYYFPNAVFVTENNLIEMPKVRIYHKKVKRQDVLFLAGDVQPINEESCYEFCETIVEMVKKWGGEEIITLGGIGLIRLPKKPKVYVTGTNKKVIQKYKGCDKEIYGVVGPIIGVAGVLLGLAEKKKIPAVSLLAQTFGHQNYVGIKGARELLNVLSQRLNVKVNVKQLDEEIEEMEKTLRARAQEMLQKSQQTMPMPAPRKEDLNYFG